MPTRQYATFEVAGQLFGVEVERRDGKRGKELDGGINF